MHTLKFLLGFTLLSLYLRLLPGFINGNPVFWLAVFILFFPLAHFVGRWSSGAGLNGMGYARKVPWKKWLGLGILVGSTAWLLLTAAQLAYGSLQFLGWQPLDKASWVAVQAVVVALLGSATNDVLTRGFVWAHWKDRLPATAIVGLSTLLYIVDDAWLEGWSIRNTVFSLFLGLAFAIALVRTRSLWMNTGLHAGLNFIYFLVYGFDGGNTNYGVFTSTSQGDTLSSWFGTVAALAVLVITLLLTRKNPVGERSGTSKAPQEELHTFQAG